MSTNKLPPLPEPLQNFAYLGGKCQDLFGAKQLTEYGQASRKAALEEIGVLATVGATYPELMEYIRMELLK